MALPLLACLGTATSITRYSVSVSVFGAPKNAILDCANSVSDGRRTKPSIHPSVCLAVQHYIILLTRVASTFNKDHWQIMLSQTNDHSPDEIN